MTETREDPATRHDPDRKPVSAVVRRVPFRRRLRRGGRALLRLFVTTCGAAVLRLLSRTWRMQIIGEELMPRAGEKGRGAFLALWHGRMLLGLPHHGSRDWYALVSGSQDGEITRALLDRFGYRVIRGSTTHGGASAIREILTLLGSGGVLTITPDGPRGPRHSVNAGLAWLARATGYPIIPIGFACDRAWRARSWDRFTVPRPWARVVMICDEPVRVDRSAGDVELAAASEQIRERLLRSERRGFALLQKDPDW